MHIIFHRIREYLPLLPKVYDIEINILELIKIL